jgi:hypothetical protein
MPAKKQRPGTRPAKRRAVARGKKSSRNKSSRKGLAQPGESLLIDVARTVGSTLGTLAARSSEAAERLRLGAGRKTGRKRS